MTTPPKGLREILKQLITTAYHDSEAGIDIAHSEIMKLIPSEEEIWDIFVRVKGCKLTKEDCNFRRCHSWGGCELLSKAIDDEMLRRVK